MTVLAIAANGYFQLSKLIPESERGGVVAGNQVLFASERLVFQRILDGTYPDIPKLFRKDSKQKSF